MAAYKSHGCMLVLLPVDYSFIIGRDAVSAVNYLAGIAAHTTAGTTSRARVDTAMSRLPYFSY